MTQTLAVPDDGDKPLHTSSSPNLDPIHHLARCMTTEQMARGRLLGVLRSRQARLISKARKLISELERLIRDVEIYQSDQGTGGTGPVHGTCSSSPTWVQAVFTLGEVRYGSYYSLLSSYPGIQIQDNRIPSLTGGSSLRARARRAPKQEPAYTPEFLAFWAAYPKKLKKPESFRAWLLISPTAELAQVIMAALALHQERLWAHCEEKFIPYPASWLNGKRWEDEIPVHQPRRKLPPAMQAAEDYIREELEKERHEQSRNSTHRD